MSGLIGKKIGMTSVYSAEGKNIPCTVIEAGPCVVTQIRTVEKDSYERFRLPMTTKVKAHHRQFVRTLQESRHYP